MRTFLIAVAACVGALAWAGAAHADWRYTNWEMRPQDVVAASQGAVAPARGRDDQRVFERDLAASGVFEEDGVRFGAEFYFDGPDGRLRVVRLTQTDGRACDAVPARLSAAHGAPIGQQDPIPGMRVTMWRDAQSGDIVTVTDSERFANAMGYRCHIAYQPAEEVPQAERSMQGK